MTRAEFSKGTKLDAWRVSRGRCMKCTAKLSTGNVEYHHDRECTFGGTAELKNCVALCRTCHALITAGQARVIAKSNRVRNRHLGITARKQASFPTNRSGPLKKRLSGEIVKR